MEDKRYAILVVDDDLDVLDTMRIILEQHGYEMIEARSAEEGVQRYRERRPDLVLVDLMMEEVDSGTNFVRDLRLLGNTAPIYMLSSVGNALQSTFDYRALGLDGVFQKPIDPATLTATLAARLS